MHVRVHMHMYIDITAHIYARELRCACRAGEFREAAHFPVEHGPLTARGAMRMRV